MTVELHALQKELNIEFGNPLLLEQAFTHSSYVNEHRTEHRHNERLEFLGDAVLELAVSEFLYTAFPERPEGELTKIRSTIVCEPSLVSLANELHFGRYVKLGKGEELTGGRTRPALLADVYEAFIGALFLDQGMDSVKRFLQNYVFDKVFSKKRAWVEDFKTKLQEYVQHRSLGQLDYRIVDEQGPAHERVFSVSLFLDKHCVGQGTGRSKKEAEQRAAEQALTQFKAAGR